MTERLDRERVDRDVHRAHFRAWEAELASGKTLPHMHGNLPPLPSTNLPPPPPPPGPHGGGGGGGGDENGEGPNTFWGLGLFTACALAIVCLAAMFVCGIAVGVLWL